MKAKQGHQYHKKLQKYPQTPTYTWKNPHVHFASCVTTVIIIPAVSSEVGGTQGREAQI